ncbi:MAG: DUF1365 domain-containing protein [Planctomycetota bacterium]
MRHRRTCDVEHRFAYSLYMPYLDLEELDEAFAGRWLWSARRPALARFRRSDYLGDPDLPLSDAVRDLVELHLGFRPEGRIMLLANIRQFGFVFNPAAFYYCFDRDDGLAAVVCEITNTPWKERHPYVLDARHGNEFEFQKSFHVSPFFEMDHTYRWIFSRPGRSLTVHMENHRGGQKLFDATLTLQREEINGASLARALVSFPLMSVKVVTGIYWQALRLWLKRAPFHTHPAKGSA